MSDERIDSAYALLRDSVLRYGGEPVGTVAALDRNLTADNYADCFVRDFVPSALVMLNDGEPETVRNFLGLVADLRTRERDYLGHELQPGVMPASFRVQRDASGEEHILADFGDRAIGRVAPVDSMMWWTILLGTYVRATGDEALARRPAFQDTLVDILHLALRDTFEVSPALLVPDGSCMIDRRLGVYGHPLEIQVLFYAMLANAQDLLVTDKRHVALIKAVIKRKQALRTYLRLFYWLDLPRLNEIHRYRTEEFGGEGTNLLNIYPDSIPAWLEHWLPEGGGYFVGNLGPGRLDARFFALGNLLAVAFGLATDEQARAILELYEARWADLVGEMPVKLCFPALEGDEWRLLTGSDPKNAPWSYHNGGSWPVLLWPLVLAAERGGRRGLARKAFDLAGERLAAQDWPEYYDGRTGRLIGRRANLRQVWSATAYLLADQALGRGCLPALMPD
jgi:hypothetical protein